MNNFSNSQSNSLYQLIMQVEYQHLEAFEHLFAEYEYLAISSVEISSNTIEAQAEDLWQLEILFDLPPNIEQITERLQHFAAIQQIGFQKLHYQIIDDCDWVKNYQAQLKPIIIDHFQINFSQDQQLATAADKEPIFITAAQAFGTGEHATTALCIKALNSLANNKAKFENILDVGTGSGILSFAASKLWPQAKLVACDIDKTALTIAEDSAKLNSANIDFFQNQPERLIIPTSLPQKYDLIVANILAQPLIDLATQFSALLTNEGQVIISGFLDYQVPEIVQAYAQQGLFKILQTQDQQWCCITLKCK